jgi:hypothetical protein
VLLGLVDLIVEQIQNSQIRGENRCAASPIGCW